MGTPSTDVEAGLAAVAAIRRALNEYTTGWANTVAVGEIDKHVRTLWDVAPRNSAEKIQSFSSWMGILFSARKHERYRRGGTSGESMVKSFALSDLNTIEYRIRAAGNSDASKNIL